MKFDPELTKTKKIVSPLELFELFELSKLITL